MKIILKVNLFEKHILFEDPPSGSGDVLPASSSVSGLSFEQQSCFILQFGHKFRLKAEREKELAVEIRQQMEQAHLELEQSQLPLIKEVKLLAAMGTASLVSVFVIFERVADEYG